MRRLGIPDKRRKGFKRLIFSQVFFGKNKQTGRVRELFARDFPTVYKAIMSAAAKRGAIFAESLDPFRDRSIAALASPFFISPHPWQA